MKFGRILEPAVVRIPRVHMLSLRATGIPATGPTGSVDARTHSIGLLSGLTGPVRRPHRTGRQGPPKRSMAGRSRAQVGDGDADGLWLGEALGLAEGVGFGVGFEVGFGVGWGFEQ